MNAPETDITQESIDKLIEEVFPPGHRILFHIDEHRKASENPYFRRGAFEALAEIPNCKCIATYVDALDDINPLTSSGVCRIPLPVPKLELRSMASTYPQLDLPRIRPPLPTTKGHHDCLRLMATVQCRLALFVSSFYTALHEGGLQQDLLDEFDKILSHHEDKEKKGPASVEDITTTLTECFDIINKLQLSRSRPKNYTKPESNRLVLNLMNGYSDNGINDLNQRLRPALTVVNDRLFASWSELLLLKDNNFRPFNMARKKFIEVAIDPATTIDNLSATPLERAYLWSLLCHSRLEGALEFQDVEVSFKADKLKFGRLVFSQAWNKGYMIDPTILERDVLYAAAEKSMEGDSVPADHRNQFNFIDIGMGKVVRRKAPKSKNEKNHPLCDLFFVTNDDDLVMIDITGGKIGGKTDNLFKFLSKNIGALEECGIKKALGVVLAPGVATASSSIKNDIETVVVMTVTGDNAKQHLGALEQLYGFFRPYEEWADDGNEDEDQKRWKRWGFTGLKRIFKRFATQDEESQPDDQPGTSSEAGLAQDEGDQATQSDDQPGTSSETKSE